MKKLSCIVLCLSIVFCIAGCKKDEPETTTENAAETETQTVEVTEDTQSVITLSADRNPLTGEAGYDAQYLGQKAVGIVVENHPSARPQWGMSTPDIVVEYEVEGGISRMLWLYANASRVPAKVGPVRSARHDVVELAMGWDILFIHCGGSNFADDLMAATPSLDQMDAMYVSDCFERDYSRNVATEHTLVMQGEKLASTIANRGYNMTADESKIYKFKFNEGAEKIVPDGGVCSKIDFSYSASYGYNFAFDAESGKYAQYRGSSPATDADGIHCAYDNVIILYVDMIDLGDSSGHQDLKLENGGTGIYCTGGNYTEITWQKPSENSALRLYDKNGNDLVLNTGRSYLGLVRSTQSGKTVIE